jgi:hypothetical protein
MQKSILTTAISFILMGTTQTVYAIRPEPPSLLSPSNGKKVPLKDLKFTWTAPDNDAIVKTKAYNIMISIYSDFHDKKNCDQTGSGSCINIKASSSPIFNLKKTDPVFAFFNKKNTTFYWKVQAISGVNDDVGNYSVPYKFSLSDTLNIPKLDRIAIKPLSAAAGSPFTFTMFLTSELLSGYSAKVDYGDGWKTLKCTGVTCVTTAVINDVGENNPAKFFIYDDKGTPTDSTPYYGNYSVTAADEIPADETPAEMPPEEILNTPPTVTLVSGLDSVVKNSTYTLKLKANDVDGNLNRIEINWQDGKIDTKAAADGTTLTFTHVYKFAGIYPLIATAIDNSDAYSNDLTKSLKVTEPAVTPVVTPTVKVPSVSTLNASPASVTQGETVTFSTTLSADLPTGYTVKINYGNGLVKMNGSGKSFTLVATPSNSASYSIGVYDSKGVLKSNQLTSNFEITAPKPVNVAPTLSFVSGDTKATTGISYTVKLKASDNDGNLSQTVIDWGDGYSDSQTGATPTFSHTFTTAGSFAWNAIAYDTNDTASSTIFKTVAVSKPAPVVVAPPVTTTKTTGYTKIANNGSVLADSAKLGTAPTDWACTKDNKTGLIWEVKTDDDGLRDKDWYYSWYEPDASKNGGFEGYKNNYLDDCKGSECDTYAFTNAVNKQGLCGKNDWRMPTKDELMKLVACSDGKYDSDDGECTNYDTITRPTINTTYFPDTTQTYPWFWTSSLLVDSPWIVYFGSGSNVWTNKNQRNYVRLVRG